MKRFKTNDGSDVRVAQLSGHVAWVGANYAELDDRFHKDAYALGCVSEDMVKNEVLNSVSQKEAESLISKSTLDEDLMAEFKRIVDENDQDAMTAKGPDASKLTKKLGKRISTQKRNAMWYKFQQEQEAE